MHPRDGCAPGDQQWRAFWDSFDSRTVETVQRYEERHGLCYDSQLAEAFNEYFRLRLRRGEGGGDPDYTSHAMPVAYALYEAPRRVTTMVIALHTLAQALDKFYPSTVLDIGSGTDAVSLALEATGILASHHKVICLEPGSAMRNFAKLFPTTVEREHYDSTLEDFVRIGTDSTRRGSGRRLGFDLICLSFALQYSHNDQERETFYRIGRGLVTLLNEGGVLIYVGPNAKHNVALEFKDALMQYADTLFEGFTSEVPNHINRDVALSRIYRYLGGRFPHIERSGLSAYSRSALIYRDSISPPRTSMGLAQDFFAVRRE